MDLIYLGAGAGMFALFAIYAVLFEARLIMVVAVIYIAAAVGVAIYMLVALLRPEKF